MPTHAQIGSDGTVTSRSYLTCGSAGTCVAAPAPVVAKHLSACGSRSGGSAGASTNEGTTDTACIWIYDAANQTYASGSTLGCVGDWECPQGSLCDDMVVTQQNLSAICKPGPRGVLTPAMLSE